MGLVATSKLRKARQKLTENNQYFDAKTVLSRSIAEIGIYPAVDPLDSSSRILDPKLLEKNTMKLLQKLSIY